MYVCTDHQSPPTVEQRSEAHCCYQPRRDAFSWCESVLVECDTTMCFLVHGMKQAHFVPDFLVDMKDKITTRKCLELVADEPDGRRGVIAEPPVAVLAVCSCCTKFKQGD